MENQPREVYYELIQSFPETHPEYALLCAFATGKVNISEQHPLLKKQWVALKECGTYPNIVLSVKKLVPI